MNAFLSAFNKQTAIASVIKSEGGDKYTNDPADSGGPTRYGITQVVAQANRDLWATYGFNGDMQTLPEGLAVAIYSKQYWDINSLDGIYAISPTLTYLLFSIGVNSGVGTAGKHLQRVLNSLNNGGTLYADIATDGGVGKGTVAALNAAVAKLGNEGLRNIIMAVKSLQDAFYIADVETRPKDEKYTSGWYNRMNNILSDVGLLNPLAKGA
jgi:lysozyme family protein